MTSIKYPSLMGRTKPCAVPNPDLEIKGGGGGVGRSSRSLDKGETGLPKIFFKQFGPKIRAAGPLGPSPVSATGVLAITKNLQACN